MMPVTCTNIIAGLLLIKLYNMQLVDNSILLPFNKHANFSTAATLGHILPLKKIEICELNVEYHYHSDPNEWWKYLCCFHKSR